MRPAGLWGPKEFAQFTEDELHETMMGDPDLVCQVLSARGEYSDRDRERIERLSRLFRVDNPLRPARRAVVASDELEHLRAKAS